MSANEWYHKAIANDLDNRDVCLTFDDTLLCQYDIALPMLEKYGLNAFWFVYTSVLFGEHEKLEIYRKFRTVCFANIEEFYDEFFCFVENTIFYGDVQQSLKEYSHDDWSHFPFYSRNDTKFRFIRDVSLGSSKYNHVMDTMMKERGIHIGNFVSDLWMDMGCILELKNRGHLIGLHSHTHPTQLAKLSKDAQRKEYRQNYTDLFDTLGVPPRSVAYPCNSYNKDTLDIMLDMDIQIGFRANMAGSFSSNLEFPREDHANVVMMLDKVDGETI